MRSVLIIEDQTAVREMLAQVVESDPTLNVIAQTGSGQEAYDLCIKEKPDVVILDVMLPGLSGAELMRRVGKLLKETRVLVFSGYQTPALVRELMQAGAHGFVEKTAPLSELRAAIQAVANGGNYFGPEVTKIVSQTLANPNDASVPSLNRLTPREREILVMIARGSSTKDIAAKLNVSVKTAENHRSNLMRKLNVHNAAALTRFAMEQGLIQGV